MNIKQLSMLILASAAALLAGCASSPQGQATEDLARIEHIVVIYAENRSFDHLYGLFAGVDGIASATPEQKTQVDHDGNPLPHLPPVYEGGRPSPEFPQGLPNGPFRIDAPPVNRRMDEVLPSPIHAFYHNREQINGGKNNMFVAMSNLGGWVMGHFDGSQLRMWQWAKEYTLADNFFMGAFGGSYLNHHWLICACTPRHEEPPDSMRARLDVNGKLDKKPESPSAKNGPVQVYSTGGGQVSPDSCSVNTTQPPYQPSGIPPESEANRDWANPKGTAQRGVPLPPQSSRTI